MDFKLVSDYQPMGDQPQAIDELVRSIQTGSNHNTLLGVTGSGKTFTIANVIKNLNRPTLVLSHNKTLAAQLYSEFKGFFPDNCVEYFVSYYDYYQPEAYLPASDTYIEKDLAINEEIDKMRLHTTTSLLSGRRDVIVVASVSCIYGIGNPDDFHANTICIKQGELKSRKRLMYDLVDILYTRTEKELTPATFRVVGDTIDIMPPYSDVAYRVMFFDDEIEALASIDPATGQRIERLSQIRICPDNLFVTTKERTAEAVRQLQ
ncbi:MAG: DEAD/DEAH box helicase family protein, partial [Rikenellaceae bacterium]|nr:DEAD/DEAH box helicase family protein [Rikenellaceae bacterium]